MQNGRRERTCTSASTCERNPISGQPKKPVTPRCRIQIVFLWKCEKMVFSDYKKQRVLALASQGLKAPTIARELHKENLMCSRVAVYKFLRKYEETGSISRRVGSGRPSKETAEIKRTVEEQMRKDDETTAYQLHCLLSEKGYSISLRTILRCRMSLGWTFRGSVYCQLIHNANKVKRLQWAQEHRGDSFDDVIWTDECTVQLESHRRFACQKRGEAQFVALP